MPERRTRRGQAHYLGYGSGLGVGCRKPAQPSYLICTRFCHCWFSWQMNSIISEPSATISCSTLTVKGCRVRLRIVDRDVDLQSSEVHAPEPLGQPHTRRYTGCLWYRAIHRPAVGQAPGSCSTRPRACRPPIGRRSNRASTAAAPPAAGDAGRRCRSCEGRSSTRR